MARQPPTPEARELRMQRLRKRYQREMDRTLVAAMQALKFRKKILELETGVTPPRKQRR